MQHKNSTDIHQGAYVQANDPGAVGPNLLWIDTSVSPSIFKKRNTGNTAWDQVGNALANPMTGVGDFIIGGTAGTPVRFPPGAAGQALQMVGANPTWVSEVTGTDFKPSGLGAATGPSRYVGATVSGSPVTGTFAVGDWVVDQTPSLWMCTVAGAPGTWKQLSGGSSGGGGGGSIALQTAMIADVTATSANTWYDSGMSLSLTPGNWYITARVQIAGSAGYATLKIWDGGSIVAASMESAEVSGSSAWSMNLSGYVTLTSTTTMKLSYNGTGAGGIMQATVPANNTGLTNTSSQMQAISCSPVLLTSNSNLLAETVLTSAQANISIANIPQGYRDLRIEIQARGDTAGNTTGGRLQLNGDTGSNYNTQTFLANGTGLAGSVATAASFNIGDLVAAAPVAGHASGYDVSIPNYSASTFYKNIQVRSGNWGNSSEWNNIGVWLNTAPVTSLTFFASAGNLIAGSVVRVYGDPVSAGGASVGTGTRLRNSATQSATTAVPLVIGWDTEDNDADNQHYTSVAALTGTVSKTAASATLPGVGTLFLTELSVGQVISVPGVATEVAVVTAIASNTSLTVSTAFANTSATQTATRVNSAVVFRQPGFYTLESTIYSAAISAGVVTLQFRLNGTTIIDQKDQAGVNALAAYELITQRQFQQWDYVEVLWTQNSGGSVLVQTDERTHWSIGARPTVIVAVPYVNIQDQKASGTAGGTFTSGAWQTRTLNTVQSDIAGISSLATNQVTLPSGIYRCNISAPAYQCNEHVLRLRNITLASTILSGQAARSAVTGNNTNAYIVGKFVLPTITTLEVQHICETTSATEGLGAQAGARVTGGVATEVYTIAEFWKEG